MAITKDDLNDFTHFATEKLENGGATTLSDLVYEWESHRMGREPIQTDLETVRKLAKFFPDVHEEEILRRRLDRRDGVTTAEMLGKAMLAAVRAGRA
jgi:hypothetical protein